MLYRLIASLLFMTLLVGCGAQPTPRVGVQPSGGVAPVAEINPADLKSKLDGDARLVVLDVRSPEEYAQDGHIAGSLLIPLPELAQRMSEIPSDQPIACICRSGNRSLQACDLLAQQGFTNLSNVQGGMQAWARAGYPVE
jgi:rhodanese-related sulfurtransferase